MKHIKFRSRTEHVLRTTYVVMYAFRSNTELVPVFQSTRTIVQFEIPAESGRNVQPRSAERKHKGQEKKDKETESKCTDSIVLEYSRQYNALQSVGGKVEYGYLESLIEEKKK